MTNKINNEEMKIKEQFLINIKSRNDEKKYKFTKWLNAQSNPQNSFLSLIEHCIDRFGYEDVTDHGIAKKLHTEIPTATNHINKKNSTELEPPKMKQKPAAKEKVIEEKKVEVNEEENNIDADLSSF